ncbi:hypothetical protein CDO52_03425 [Nocardiopsis gilva YIM 90087]|uniref:DUF2269 domain-containing protein n=1 Tax=Nocardiopsis gilva YIM 90087 TaxID=1235441 RepID=A0A223S1I9_9ACTN|nr:hypothetical protein [Nocardiopsis gilva]ASU81957.1 hypothetical protein CDO52_03425 [Nocardiopsis gilva YIM 90087]
MTKVLLSLHVLAAILAVGPIAVAASLFPRYARQAAAVSGGRPAAVAAVLHRVCRVYTVVGIAVPVLGFATAAQMGVLADAWVIASVVLTGAAAVLLGAAVLPAQGRMLAADGAEARSAARLAMLTGVFNLLWAVVVVLMIVRPGSTTGA